MGSVMILPNAYADDFVVSEECVGGTWKGIITNLEGEIIPNTIVRTMEKITDTNYEKKFVSNENGIVEIPFEDNTGVIWIQKGGFNDNKTIIELCTSENTINSNTIVIIETNPDISYDGEFWNFNDGSGIPIAVIVDGNLQNNGIIKLTTTSVGNPTFVYEEIYSINTGFPKHLFNLDYPFKFDQEYTFTAENGISSSTITTIPLPSNSFDSKEIIQDTIQQNSRISIIGETNPIVTKGMISKYKYQVEVNGPLEYNYQVGGKGGWLEKTVCQNGYCNTPDKAYMISETDRIFEFEQDFDYFWKLDEQFKISDYDPKPKLLQYKFQFGDDVGIFNVYPEWKKIDDTFTVSEDALAKISTKSANLIKYMKAGMDNRWFMIIEVCSGQNDLQKPTIIISSDIESTPFTLNKSINKLSCARDEFQVKAVDPESVQVGLERLDVISKSSEFNELKAELAELKAMLTEKEEKPKVPGWIKNNVQWWADGQVDDQTFLNGIEFMVKEKVINIPVLPEQSSDVADQKIPDWIRNNAIWWSEGAISEDDFVNGIEFLVQKGIVRVQ